MQILDWTHNTWRKVIHNKIQAYIACMFFPSIVVHTYHSVNLKHQITLFIERK